MAQPYLLIPASGATQSDEWVRLGIEAQMMGKFPDAERHYRQALRLDPQHVIATQNFAVLYAQTNNLIEALLTMERASLFDGVNPIVYANRAFMCLEADRIDEALAAARQGLAMGPTTETRLALAVILATAGLPDEAIPLYNAILDQHPQHLQAGPNACFVQTLTTATPADLQQQRAKWYRANRYHGEKKPHPNERTGTRQLKVGYVSGDFKTHSAAMIFSAVLLQHDPAQVEMFLYSTLPVDPAADPKTKLFQEAVGPRWRDIAALTDEQADALIRQDQIDILVDLAGHTNGGRLALFTRKPAPIQVTAWGFAHGTGCPEIDYFLADPVTIPPEERRHYAETVLDLPCVVTYQVPSDYQLKGSSPLPYHQHGVITFGTYARYEKLSDGYLRTCHAILTRVNGSRMHFKDHAFRRPYAIRRILGAMPGIDKGRLLFSISTNHQEHLSAMQQADIMLDPFPHSGGVVGLEQLYMGVPIVTLYGSQAAGRTTSSVLTAMGRLDWIAKTPDDYIERAVALAQDIPALIQVRQTLREELLASPVIIGYREAVEATYRTIWQKWCAS